MKKKRTIQQTVEQKKIITKEEWMLSLSFVLYQHSYSLNHTSLISKSWFIRRFA